MGRDFASSKILLFASIVLIISAHLYYPKWQKSGTEATISWDVSGYYMYLPAIFIYHDLEQYDFVDELRSQYGFTPDFQQAFLHEESGHYVMKYSIGQAILYSPCFFLAHTYASMIDTYPADGFSRPYQLSLSIWSLLVSFLGILFSYRALRYYFSTNVSAVTVLLILLGSNHLNYVAIDGAMSHNYLFTLFSAIILSTIQFYKRPRYSYALGIGVMVGLCALTRPTEILISMIPLLWGVDYLDRQSWSDRFSFLSSHRYKVIFAIISCLAVGSVQLFYWYYITGHWTVYSYQDQGFSWLQPHIISGLFSYRAGWLIYSPFMIFSLVGFYYLFSYRHDIIGTCLVFFLLFIYVAFSWDIWWYGGSFGQRTMVHCGSILVFPLAAFIDHMRRLATWIRVFIGLIITLFIYLNFWYIHQAHRGGLLHAGNMTKAYFWKTLGTYDHDVNDLKLLDTDEYFKGDRSILGHEILSNDPFKLNHTINYSEIYQYKAPIKTEWYRVIVEIEIGQKEHEGWKMVQLIAHFKNDDESVKYRFIRIHRLLSENDKKVVFLDVKSPKEEYDKIEVYLWNPGSTYSTQVNRISIEAYNEIH